MEHKKKQIEELERLSVEAYKASEKLPFVVVLDNVRSMYNVGSVFRTSDAYRVSEVVLCGICAVPPHMEIHKTALGAELSVAHRYFKETLDAVRALKREGFTVFAVEQAAGSVRLEELNIQKNGKYAVVLGHEVFGVQQAVIDECDGCVELPQYGTKHSLNVSVTAGIVIYEVAKRLMNT